MDSDYVDVPYITLRTPPPSPGTQILLGETTPTLMLSHSSVTPTRKRRSAGFHKKRKKKRTVAEDDGVQEQTPFWDSTGADLDMGSEPFWSSPERPLQTSRDVTQDRDLHELGYSEYCENIHKEGGAFYQIAADLFVVNGWDPQKKTSKVSMLMSGKASNRRRHHTELLVPPSADNHWRLFGYCLPMSPESS